MPVKQYWIFIVVKILLILLPIKVNAADRIAFSYSFFGEFDINIADLEHLVETGEITSDLAYYTNRLPKAQQQGLATILTTPLEINPLTVAKFTNSDIGEIVLKNFGKGIRSDFQQNGFYALRSATIASAFDPEGLTIINILRHFPLETIYIDLDFLEKYLNQWQQLFRDRQLITREFIKPNVVKTYPQLQQPGELNWFKETFSYDNPNRATSNYFDLYLPRFYEPVPIVVISHGFASNRRTFAYLAEHLASHGFAVVVIEHPDINSRQIDNFLEGSKLFPEPTNLIDRPQDITYVLDKLEQQARVNPRLQDKLNLQQIGAIGQSFGGYSVLALAGAKLDRAETVEECQENEYDRVFFDLSSLAKCTLNSLPDLEKYPLQDRRIKAIIAINPFGKIFGKQGMAEIEIPTAIFAGTNDLITPPVPEQIQPFSWLKTNPKYLVLVREGTHFSFLEEGIGVLPVPDIIVGPSSRLAHPAIKAFSTAFFKTYIAEEAEYQIYLTRDLVAEINSNPFQLSLIRSLTQFQLEDILQRKLRN